MIEMIRGLIGLEKRCYLLVEERLDSLIAVVVKKNGSKAELSDEYVVPMQNYNHAVADLLKVMNNKGVSVPESVVLISPDVIANLTNLPVHPNKRKTNKQMEELLRWELGPILEQSMMDRSLGMLMMAKGMLDLDQVIKVVSKQKEGLPVAVTPDSEEIFDEQNQVDMDKKPRFGEIAIALGYVSESEVRDCLDIQQDYQSSGGENVCSYALAKKIPEVSNGSYPWLTAISYDYLIKKRVRAFSKAGLKLLKIYPSTASLGPLLHCQKNIQEKAAVMDIRDGQLDVSVFEHEGCCYLENYLLDTKNIGLTEELKDQYLDEIWLKAGYDPAKIPDEYLKKNYQIRPLEQTKKIKSPKSIGENNCRIFSTAIHVCDLAPASSASPLTLDKEVPEVFKSKIWLRLVLIICAVVISAIEGVYWSRYFKVEGMKAEVQIYKSLKSSNSKLRDDKNKISKAIKAAQELISFNKEIYPAEKIFLSSLMAKISTSTPENLILTLIENNINEKIILKGWSIDAEAANDFSEKLAEYTQETNIIVQTPLISGGKPFFGVEGYGFEMELFMVEKGF